MSRGTRRAVADALLRQGVARRLAIYPSLDQALANARARPPRLRERLALGPVPTAAGAGRAFVGEVCDRWALGGLAGSAALLANELVTNAVVHARTALELRVELRGPQLRVAVRDQDPNLARVLAAKEGTGRGLGLEIVDRVATAWGVRQVGAGGKIVWCTLDLPRSSEAMSPPGPDLVLAKLWPPTSRAGLIPRADLQALLQASLQGRLCLLDAPAGFGKTTLLTQWRAVAGASQVAWVSLEEADNDPTRFWTYVVEALRTVEPGVGASALEALGRPSADLYRAVLPGLLNELSTAGLPLFLVLDDYHLITNPTCHQTLTFFLDHLPADVHVALSGRTDPPLPLARMRARESWPNSVPPTCSSPTRKHRSC